MKVALLTTDDDGIADEIWVGDKLLARGAETSIMELYSRMLLLGLIGSDDMTITPLHSGDGVSWIETEDNR